MAKREAVYDRTRPTPTKEQLVDAQPRVEPGRTAPQVVREGLQIKIEPVPELTKPGLVPAEGVYFQCPPLEEFTVEHAHAHTDYDTARIGEMSRKGGRRLKVITFDTLVVDWGTYTLLDQDIEIEDFTRTVREICDSGTPFEFTASHQQPPGGFENWSLETGGPEAHFIATLRNLRVTEKAGEGDARYLNCEFHEYRDPVVGERDLGAPRRAKPKLPVTGTITPEGVFRYTPPNSHTRREVKGTKPLAADPESKAVTLADLARHFYGDPSAGRHIAAANGIKDWGIHTVLIKHARFKKGGRLKIPKKPGRK